MSNQKADVVAVKPATPCSWDDSEVVPLRQDGPPDSRELLFVGWCSLEGTKVERIRTISTRVVTSPSKGDKYLS